MKKYKFEIKSEIVDPDGENIVCPWMDAEVPPDILRVAFIVAIKAKTLKEAKKNVKYLIEGRFKGNWMATHQKPHKRP